MLTPLSDHPLAVRKNPTQTPAGVLFLLGCMTLPFFNDFPLFAWISAAFRDLSTIFFLASAVCLVFEYLVANQRNLGVSYKDIFFVIGSMFLVWVSALWNIETSGSICGEKICGVERILGSAISMSARLVLLLVFVHFVKRLSMSRICTFIRVGFYLSFCYVLLELFDSYVPYYLGYYSGARVLNTVESYFHLRVNDIGGDRTRGLAFEPSYQALFLITCLPFLVADKIKIRRIANVFGWLICLISSASLTGLIAATMFLIVYAFRGAKLILATGSLALFGGALAFALLFNGYIDLNQEALTSTISRTSAWIAGGRGILDNPLFGVGPGMSGYWVTKYYPDYFALSWEKPIWYEVGRTDFDAPTFASLFSFVLDYGVVPAVLAVAFILYIGVIQDAARSSIGRASIVALFVASFGLSGYSIWGYWLFSAITLSRAWGRLDDLKRGVT